MLHRCCSFESVYTSCLSMSIFAHIMQRFLFSSKSEVVVVAKSSRTAPSWCVPCPPKRRSLGRHFSLLPGWHVPSGVALWDRTPRHASHACAISWCELVGGAGSWTGEGVVSPPKSVCWRLTRYFLFGRHLLVHCLTCQRWRRQVFQWRISHVFKLVGQKCSLPCQALSKFVICPCSDVTSELSDKGLCLRCVSLLSNGGCYDDVPVSAGHLSEWTPPTLDGLGGNWKCTFCHESGPVVSHQ